MGTRDRQVCARPAFVCRDDQLHRAHRAPDAGCRSPHAAAVVHRPRRGPGLRALRPRRRRRRVRHVPLPDAARERARLLLLARSHHRRADAALGMVRHQVADRAARRHVDQYLDLVRAPALLRSDARAIAQGRSLSAARRVVAKLDTIIHELYHIDPDETGIRRFVRADGTDSMRIARAAVLRAGRGDDEGVSRDAVPIRSCTSSCRTISRG